MRKNDWEKNSKIKKSQITSLLLLPLQLCVSVLSFGTKYVVKWELQLQQHCHRSPLSSSFQITHIYLHLSANTLQSSGQSSVYLRGFVQMYPGWWWIAVRERRVLWRRADGVSETGEHSRLSRMEELQLPNIRAAGLDTPTSSAHISRDSLRCSEVCREGEREREREREREGAAWDVIWYMHICMRGCEHMHTLIKDLINPLLHTHTHTHIHSFCVRCRPGLSAKINKAADGRAKQWQSSWRKQLVKRWI